MNHIYLNYTKKILSFFLAFFLFSIFLSCENKKETPQEIVKQVRGVVVKLQDIPNEINGFGTLSFLKKVDISAPQDGVISKLPYREGDIVKKGNRVVILENPQITLAVGRARNAYTQAQAAVDLAKSRLLEGEFQAEAQILNLEKIEDELVQSRKAYAEQERKHQDQEALFAAGGITVEAIRTSRFSLESASEQIRILEKELEIRKIGFRDRDLVTAGFKVPDKKEEKMSSLIKLSTATLRAEVAASNASLDATLKELDSAKLAESELIIISPVPGTIGARYLEEGERVKKEDKILTLIDTDSLYAIFPVRESDALRLDKGMQAKVKVDGTGGIYDGKVDLVSPSADSQSFTFSVRVLLPKEAISSKNSSKENLLKPGMFARVSIILGPPRKAIIIPESSLLNKKNNEATIFVVHGDTVSERKLTIGESFGENREVISGLSAGDVIVNRPDTSLRDGEYVSVVD